MTNALAFDKLEVWLRCPRPRPREGRRGCAISSNYNGKGVYKWN